MNFERDGIQLKYGTSGNGLAVVLIHGFPLNRQMWLPQINALVAAGFRVITPDLRGFGDSAAPSGGYSMDIFADDIVALLDHLSIEKAVIGGMSMGGYVLLNLLDRHRSRISAPCFIVTRSGADDDAGKAKRKAMADDVTTFGTSVVADIFAKLLFADSTLREKPELVAQVAAWMQATSPAGLVGGLLAMRDRKDYTPILESIDLPSLVIGAAEDKAMSKENLEIFTSRLPRASTALISGAGHMVNLEQPEAFNENLLRFLQGLNLEQTR